MFLQVRDMEEHPGKVPRHAAGLEREGVLLRRGVQGVLFRPRPRHIQVGGGLQKEGLGMECVRMRKLKKPSVQWPKLGATFYSNLENEQT